MKNNGLTDDEKKLIARNLMIAIDSLYITRREYKALTLEQSVTTLEALNDVITRLMNFSIALTGELHLPTWKDRRDGQSGWEYTNEKNH